MAETAQPSGNDWKHGTFECCDSPTDCLCAFFLCPCYCYQATVAAGESGMCGVLAACFVLPFICVRGNAREKKSIDGTMVNDILCTCCCGPCTAIQLKREFDESV